MIKTWDNASGEAIAKINIDDQVGILIEIRDEENQIYGKEIVELQTLETYPPADDKKIEGEKNGNWVTYKIKIGTNWEIAKTDILTTFDFWFGGKTPQMSVL